MHRCEKGFTPLDIRSEDRLILCGSAQFYSVFCISETGPKRINAGQAAGMNRNWYFYATKN